MTRRLMGFKTNVAELHLFRLLCRLTCGGKFEVRSRGLQSAICGVEYPHFHELPICLEYGNDYIMMKIDDKMIK